MRESHPFLIMKNDLSGIKRISAGDLKGDGKHIWKVIAIWAGMLS